jgi:rare lipoprotein A
MQTKLRMLTVPAMTFVAGLLSTSALPAATAPKTVHSAASSNQQLAGRKPNYVGVASWYGKPWQGRKMANGKPFDRNKMTAAAWNIPLGTMVKVVNLKNGNVVDVTVTDRGPHPRLRRAIDLSEAAATRLDYIQDGLTSVFIIPMPNPNFESSVISAELIEPVDAAPSEDAPLQLEMPGPKPAVIAASLVSDVANQSR